MDAQHDLVEQNHIGSAHPTHLLEDIKNHTKESAQTWHQCKTESLTQQQAHFKQYESHHFAQEMQIHHDSLFAHSPEAMHNRTKLENAARNKFSVPQMKIFEKDLSAFEKNAVSNNLDEKKISKFYETTADLLKTKSLHYSASQKNELALELVHHAAHPETVVQGDRDTCNVATVEYRLLVREPQAVAEMAAQVAKNGAFITSDNSKLIDNWHSIRPDKSSAHDLLDPLLQTTLVNCHWVNYKRWDEDPASYRYETDRAHEIGERIFAYDNGQKTPMQDTEKGGPVSDPNLETKAFREIYNQASGAADPAFAIEHANPEREVNVNLRETTEDCNYVKSPKELHDILTQAIADKQFPLVVGVHTGNRPFSVQEHRGNPDMAIDDHNYGWHAIAITKYDAATHTVKIHNSWGKETDVNINLDQLYKAMQKPSSWKNGQINHLK